MEPTRSPSLGAPRVISVIIPTRNPHPGRLQRTLDGLAAQTLSPLEWELVVVDNGSHPPLSLPALPSRSGRIVVEPSPGLTRARLAGLRATDGEVVVFVDDDNVLAPRFLESARDLFTRYPRLGAAGGPVTPSFEQPPPEWTREFFGLLALRDLGPVAIIASGSPGASWPDCAPVGAGLCVRRAAAGIYAAALATAPGRLALDRTGRSLASGGDSDLVFTALHAGWDVAYFPDLAVTHLIPATRLEPSYLAALNEGIQRTWVRVLALHGCCPWRRIAPWTVPLRSVRAWFRERAWSGAPARIRWRGRRGRFLGQADLSPS